MGGKPKDCIKFLGFGSQIHFRPYLASASTDTVFEFFDAFFDKTFVKIN